jgi:hypothetical protein
VFDRALADHPPHIIKCKMTGLTLESCSHQWTVTIKAEQFACGKETKITDVSATLPPGFPTVPNCHENAAVAALAKKTPGGSAMVTVCGRIVGTWPPQRRDAEWKTKNPQTGREEVKHLTFYDFAINDGTGQLDISVQGEQWEPRLKQVKAVPGDVLFIFDMRAKWESDGGVVSMHTVRDRDPVLKKVAATDTKRVFAAESNCFIGSGATPSAKSARFVYLSTPPSKAARK